MPRCPAPLLPTPPSAIDSKPDAKPAEKAAPKTPNWGKSRPELPEEKLAQLKPGTKLPNGKRVPPPPRPHPKGEPFPKKKPREESNESVALFNREIKLRTRSECEKVCERVTNWLKDDVIDPNKANALLNAVGKVLQSKTDTENMELKIADRELMRRIHEMEEQVAQIEERALEHGRDEKSPLQ